VLFASWTAHIPHVKEYLRLNDGSLGFALLGAPVGSVLAMLVVARLLPRFGSRLIVRITLVGYCLVGPLVGLAGSVLALFAALMLWGAFQGTLDVSMNTQAISVERQTRRALMPGFHGSWSIGSFAGAAIGAAGVAIGLSLSGQLLILAAPCLLIGGWLTIGMVPDARPRDDRHTDQPRQAIARSVWIVIAVLGAIAVADMLCEGAAADWAAVYLRTSLGAVPAVAALGFTAYLLAMVVIRFAGNPLLARFAPRKLLPALAVLATAMFATGLAINSIPFMLIGFAGLGAGIGAVIPVVFSAAGRVPGINAGTAVAMVSACGWAGFVCGPVVIGQLANATSLRLALTLIPVLTAVIAVSTAICRALRTS
jgi:MFS family permease